MLAHQSVEETELFLGRNLTFLETKWLDYSSQKPDYILFYNSIFVSFLFYTLLPLPYMIKELMHSNTFKIQPKIKNSFSDMLDCYTKVIRTFLLVVIPLQIFSYPVFQMVGIRTSLPLPSGWEVLSQLSVYVIVEDYSTYWFHRGLHSKWGYSKIHRVHHEYTAPIAFAAPHAHWAEIIIVGFSSFLGPLMVPGHIITFWLWIIIRQMETVEAHSGYEFPWSPAHWIPFYAGATYHDYHHFIGGKSQSNFASVFTYCDYIYGTDKGYRYLKGVQKDLRKPSQHINKM